MVLAVMVGAALGLLVGAGSALAADGENRLRPGESLSEGESIRSANGRYQLILQHDGNLVLYDLAPTVDDAGSDVAGGGDSTGDSTAAQPDTTATPVPVWHTHTVGVGARRLVMQTDGNLVLYRQPITVFQALWHSRTQGSNGAYLLLRDTGDLTLGHADGRILWKVGASTPDAGLTGTKHVLYEREAQRIWLVEANGSISDSYPVSGREGTPAPGRYRVYSKSALAWSFEPGVTMDHMVRFARGSGGAAIGFHSIPVNRYGTPIQTEAELGQYRSAGCVRQRNDKARQLFDWAPIGTPVVVV